MGISTLKDILWEELNKESNKIEGKVDSIAHRAKDLSHLQEELKEEGEDEDLSYEYVNDDEDIEDLEDFEYEEDWEEDKKLFLLQKIGKCWDMSCLPHIPAFLVL